MGCGASKTFEESKKLIKNKITAEPHSAKSKVVFVLGGPGSGKGTQCAKLVSDFGFVHLSTGDLLRDEVKNKGPQAEKIEATLKEGSLVSSEMLVTLIKSAFEKHGMKGKFLLDGFPRSQGNIDAWNSMMNDIVDVSCLLYLTCSEETMEKRLIKRGETSGRADDNAESIIKRFKTFKTETEPILVQFREKGKVVEISAEGGVDDVYHVLKEAIISKAGLTNPNELDVNGKPKLTYPNGLAGI